MALSARCLLIAGSGSLALPVTRLMAAAGVPSFVFLTSLSDTGPNPPDHLVEAVREAGTGAGIRLIQVPRLDRDAHLFPQEVDFLLDCASRREDHLALESACRAQGLPLALACEEGERLLTGLVDPYAGSLACLFGAEDLVRELEADGGGPADLQTAAHLLGRQVLAALTGRVSFFRTELSLFDRMTGRRGSLPFPAAIPSYERLVLIGSDARKLGKTTLSGALAGGLVKRGRPVRALKIEIREGQDFPRVQEDGPDAAKPGVRALFEAGCERVVRLTVSEAELGDLLPLILGDIYETMDGKGILLCESNTARRFLQPAYFVQLKASGGEIKASARRTRRLADRILSSPFTDGDVAGLLEEIG